MKVTQVFYPKFSDGAAARKQLEDAQMILKVLEKNHIAVNTEQLEAETKRIDQETQDPKRLDQIKSIFSSWRGFDQAAYQRVFILPQLVERLAYQNAYFADHSFQTDRRALLTGPTLSKSSEIEVGTAQLNSQQKLEWKHEKIRDIPASPIEPPPFDTDRRVEIWNGERILPIEYGTFLEWIKNGKIEANSVFRVGTFFYQCSFSEAKNKNTTHPCKRTPLKSYDLWLKSEIQSLSRGSSSS